MSFIGHWQQEGQFEKMADLLDAVGLNDLTMREMIMGLKVELNITQDGDSWEFKMIAPHATRCVTFKNGDEVDQVSIVGRPVKSVISIEGDKMTEVHRDPTGASEITHITRMVNGDTMDVILEAKDVKCVGKYRRA